MTTMWPNRLFANGYVQVPGTDPILFGSAGPVASVDDLGVGHYRVNLRPPGVPGFADKSACGYAQSIDVTFARAVAELVSPTELIVRTFDAAGAPFDSSFAFAVLFNTTQGGAPPPPPPGSFYPGYPDLDLDYMALRVGAPGVPAVPNLVTGPLTPVTANSIAEIEAALGLQNREITLGAGFPLGGTLSPPAGALNCRIVIPPGETLPNMNMINGPSLLEIDGTGGGRIVGAFNSEPITPAACFDIRWLRCTSVGQEAGGLSSVMILRNLHRFSVIDCVMRNGGLADTAGNVFFFTHGCTDGVITGNYSGSLGATFDDWIARSDSPGFATERIWFVDTWGESQWRNVMRAAYTYSYFGSFTTLPNVAGPRRTTWVNLVNYLAPADLDIGGGVDSDDIYHVDCDFVFDQPANRAGFFGFGGTTGGGGTRNSLFWRLAGIHWTVFDASVMSGSILDTRASFADPGDEWHYGGDTDTPIAERATFTYTDPAAPARPAPPTIPGVPESDPALLVP